MVHSLSLKSRSHQEELLDSDTFDLQEYESTLSQLEVINQLTRGYSPTLRALDRVAAKYVGQCLRILDIGCGGGDTLRAVHRWAQRSKVKVELTGVDLNPLARDFAKNRTPQSFNIRYLAGDVFEIFETNEAEEYDVILNALLMHHLSDPQIVRLIEWMTSRARLAWFINDLQRHPIAYHFIKYATRLTRCNRLIRNDAPLSVARSFRRNDWNNYLKMAGVPREQVRIDWHWSFRYGVYYESRELKS